VTGEEMERAIDFLLKSQANLEQRIEQVNTNLGTRIEELATKLDGLTDAVRMQADSQSQFNQTVTTAITALAEAQAKTEAKVDRLAGLVERLAEG
jgi:Skp family chaperone for outer membrane proteins